MKKSDLVVLMYSGNVCYVEASRPNKVAGLEVNLKDQVWDYQQWNNVPIGKSRHISRNYLGGVIGVYDSRDIKHLDSMVSDANNAIKCLGPALNLD